MDQAYSADATGVVEAPAAKKTKERRVFRQSKVQGHVIGCLHYPEGKVKVSPGRHQEPPGQEVQIGQAQEGGYPE